MNNTILTNIGRQKFLTATPENQIEIKKIILGDGGGAPVVVDPDMTWVVNEVESINASLPIRYDDIPDTLVFEGVSPVSKGGYTIREIGLVDADGDLVAVGSTPTIVKPLPENGGIEVLFRPYLKLDNAGDIDLIVYDVDPKDHSLLYNRNLPNAHDASAIRYKDTNVESALDNRTVSVASIYDLITNDDYRREGLQFSVASFYDGKNQGGGNFIWSLVAGKSNADGGAVIDPDSTGGFDGTYNTLDDYFQAQGAGEGLGCFVRVGSDDIYPEMFGALADGIADDTGAFNRAAECAYKEGLVLKTIRDREYLLDGSVTLFTDADLQGTIVKHVKQGFTYIDIKSKKEPTTFKGIGLGGLNEFSTRVTGLPDSAVGKYVHLKSSEILTERSNPPSNTPYTKNSAFFLLNEDGDINVGLDSDYDDPNSIDVYVYDAETPINVSVSKLRVLGAGELDFSIRLQRDNTNIVIGDVDGDDEARIRTLLSVEANRCQVSSSSLSHTEYTGLGYGISVGLSCDTYIYNVNAVKGRSSIDGRHGHNVTIDRVNVGTCGSHWGNNYRIYNSIVRIITWAGKDLTVRDTTYFLVNLRPDVGGLSIGDLVLENVRVKGASAVVLGGPSNDYSLFTKPRRWFDSIKIDGLRFITDVSQAALWGIGPVANYSNHRVSANRKFHARDVHSNIPLFYDETLDRAVDIGGTVSLESIYAPTFSLSSRGPLDESIDATGRVYRLKDIYGDLILQVDANSHGGITVENSKVVRMRRVNAKPDAGGIITLVNCIYHPTNSSYIENTKALINCILRGNLLGFGAGIDGKLIRQIGCVAEKGAQNYNPNLDYFIDAEYYDGLIEPVEE